LLNEDKPAFGAHGRVADARENGVYLFEAQVFAGAVYSIKVGVMLAPLWACTVRAGRVWLWVPRKATQDSAEGLDFKARQQAVLGFFVTGRALIGPLLLVTKISLYSLGARRKAP
jgi:hypothetical protein